MPTSSQPSKDPLHGITLEQILVSLEAQYGFATLAEQLNVRCFSQDPSIKSCLKFFRKTPWARAKLERLYLKANGQKIPPHLRAQSPRAKIARTSPPISQCSAASDDNAAIWGNSINKK